MQVILRDDMDNLGKSGEVVNVKPGYARNYLLPRGLAIKATASDVARVEHEKRVIAARTAKLAKEAQAEADNLSQVAVSIARAVGEEDKLFGSVTSRDIAEALQGEGRARRRQEDPPRRADQGARHGRGAGQAGARRHRHDQGLGGEERGLALRPFVTDTNGRCLTAAPVFLIYPQAVGRSSIARARRSVESRDPMLEVVSSNPAPAARTPPHNIEAEKSVLGAIFIKPAAFDEVGTNLQVDDFFLPVHREIFEAMLAIDKRRQALDFIAVADELKTRGMLGRLEGGEAYLMALANAVPTAENVLHYARLVREKATLRRLIAACAEVQSTAYGDFGEFETFLDEAETKVFKVAQQNRRETYSSTGDLMEEVHAQPRGAHRRTEGRHRRADGVLQAGRDHGRPAAREPDHRRRAPGRRKDVLGGQRRDARGAAAQHSGADLLAGDVEVRADGAHAGRRGAHRLVEDQARASSSTPIGRTRSTPRRDGSRRRPS